MKPVQPTSTIATPRPPKKVKKNNLASPKILLSEDPVIFQASIINKEEAAMLTYHLFAKSGKKGF